MTSLEKQLPFSAPLGQLGYFPPVGSVDVIPYRDRQINRFSTARCRQLWRIGRDVHYVQGNQWIARDRLGIFPRGMGYAFTGMRSPIEGVSLPVNNKIGPAVEVEVASILKRQWVPTVVASSKDPRVEAAAQVSKDVLVYKLRAQHWPQIRYQNTWNFVTMGLGNLVSWWDETFLEVQPVGAPTAMFCADCSKGVYSQEIPESNFEVIPPEFREGLQKMLPSPEQEEEAETMGIGANPLALRLGRCPSCGGTLRKGQEGDSFEGNDVFGRPLSIEDPKGQCTIEADTPFEIYPENGGYGVLPHTMRRFGRRKVRSLDWIDEHFPGAVEEFKLTPVDPQDIMMEHPQLSDWNLMGQYDASYDTGVYDHHVFVDELVEKPTMRNPKGRYAVCIGDAAVVDEELLIKSTIGDRDFYVPRMMLHTARFRPRPDEWWANGLPTSNISRQNRYNAILFQLAYTRDTLGAPTVMATTGMQFSGPYYVKGQGSRIVFYSPDPSQPPGTKPEVIQGTLFPDGAYKELDQISADMKEDVGPQEIEYGQAPRNVGTTSGLQLLGENVERRRNPREIEFFGSIEDCWSHVLQCEWALQSEESVYEVEGDDKTWESKQYTNLSLCGQTKIKVEKEAYTDQNIYQREAAREALVDGIAVITSPVSRRRHLKLRGLPEDLNEDTNTQVDQAERYWVDFIDEQIVPVIDESIDNFAIHFEVLGTKLKKGEGNELERAVGWPEYMRLFGLWKDTLVEMETQGDLARQMYPGGRDNPNNAERYAKMMIDYKRQMAQYELSIQQGSQLISGGGQAPVLGEPPQAPPPPLFPPDMIQDRIMGIWLEKLGPQWQDQMVPFRKDRRISVKKFLQFRAVIEGYKLLRDREAEPMPTPGDGSTMGPDDKGQELGSQPEDPQVNSLPEGGRTTGRV